MNAPRNFRWSRTRCCETCRYVVHHPERGIAQCERPDGPIFEEGDRLYLIRLCDGWAQGVIVPGDAAREG